MSQQLKILVAGSFGAGKTTLIGTLADFAPLRTEVPMSSEQVTAEKTTTTVGIDFGTRRVTEDLQLHLYGLPGQARFRPVWDAARRGALGLVLMLRADGADFKSALCEFADEFLTPDLPTVFALSFADQAGAARVDSALAAVQALAPGAPVLPMDPRSKEDGDLLLEMLLAMNLAEQAERAPI
jgi:uncharacterized protein